MDGLSCSTWCHHLLPNLSTKSLLHCDRRPPLGGGRTRLVIIIIITLQSNAQGYFDVTFKMVPDNYNCCRGLCLWARNGRLCERSLLLFSTVFGSITVSGRCMVSPYDFLLVGRGKYSSCKLHHFQVIWRWIIVTLIRSLKVIQTGTIWKLGYGFLFAFHSNYGRIFNRLWDIQRQSIAWPWKLVVQGWQVKHYPPP